MEQGDITLLLQRASSGDEEAHEELVQRVYGDLERVAGRRMRDRFGPELAGVTLEPAALVNETFLKLLRQEKPVDFENRRHFFSFATQVMLRALTDYQRARAAAKRGGDRVRVTLAGLGRNNEPVDPAAEEIRAALAELEELDFRKAEVVALRVFWGCSMAEIAVSLDTSLRTVERDWRFAKSWLKKRLAGF
jgi:RNA polymerase sigma factor (TIGR02999 family)